jgi:hypothetical protein
LFVVLALRTTGRKRTFFESNSLLSLENSLSVDFFAQTQTK